MYILVSFYSDCNSTLIVAEAIRRNTFTKGATDTEIRTQVAKLLKGAHDRDGGRNRRKNATASSTVMLILPVDVRTLI